MQKIETKLQRDKRRQRNQLLIGLILVGLMILSTGGYAIMNNEKSSGANSNFIKINGITYNSDGIYWRFNLNNKDFATEYNPNQTSDINVLTKTSLANYQQKVLYFVGEDAKVNNNEIARNIYSYLTKTNGACISGVNCTGNYPLKDCSKDNIIIIKEPINNETEGITQNQNCIFITAQFSNQTRFEDAFLFKLLGV